ncbi:hypothetical protein DdX_10160 [Ditylenchus destructor]|uniref:Uncharacterized protein n=1 Tax=Ditylenchus destructor TaxID=166010 RepID=A0AAD4N0Y3_9BILA|nr:hypothetical protein DdX_10160 [Ditylenchus destructor]
MKNTLFVVFFFLFISYVDNQTTHDINRCGTNYWCPPGYGFILLYPYGQFDCKWGALPDECKVMGGICVSQKTHPEAKNKCSANCCMKKKPTTKPY